jgi:hypothetical protein
MLGRRCYQVDDCGRGRKRNAWTTCAAVTSAEAQLPLMLCCVAFWGGLCNAPVLPRQLIHRPPSSDTSARAMGSPFRTSRPPAHNRVEPRQHWYFASPPPPPCLHARGEPPTPAGRELRAAAQVQTLSAYPTPGHWCASTNPRRRVRTVMLLPVRMCLPAAWLVGVLHAPRAPCRPRTSNWAQATWA